jgi:uncharacterized Fe-S cluster-containing radical SAM superfamily protein
VFSEDIILRQFNLSLYDPLARHEAIQKLVVRNRSEGVQERKYWRFRTDRWYGGVVTADAAGCGLLCKYCWVQDAVMSKPAETGRFYTPDVVARILVAMAKKKDMGQLRVSGGEPTIGNAHLFQLLDYLEGRGLLFILETNGILIGNDRKYAEDLAKHKFIHVRVSLKGCNEGEFSTLTGAQPKGFELQLKALEDLVWANVKCHPAVMTSFTTSQSLQQLTERLGRISTTLAEKLEIEELILYPSVRRKINKHGLRYYSAYTPKGVPQERI